MKTTIKINKTGLELETGDFPIAAQEFIFNYGLRQILNDCHSSIQRKDFVISLDGSTPYKNEEQAQAAFIAAVNEAATAKLAALEQGIFTVRSGGSKEPVDPVARLVYRMAKDAINTALKAKGVKIKDLADGKHEELIAAFTDKNGKKLEAEAKKQIAAQSELGGVDLSDLGL